LDWYTTPEIVGSNPTSGEEFTGGAWFIPHHETVNICDNHTYICDSQPTLKQTWLYGINTKAIKNALKKKLYVRYYDDRYNVIDTCKEKTAKIVCVSLSQKQV
jgi:hypothetical protein